MLVYNIDAAARLVICRAVGRVGVLDVANYLQALGGDRDFNRGLDALILVSDSRSLPPFSLLRYLNPVLSAWARWRGPSKWAVVLPNVAARGMTETAVNHLTLHQVEVRCFTSEPIARQWLQEPRVPQQDRELSLAGGAV
jgi:hypothetical protein